MKKGSSLFSDSSESSCPEYQHVLNPASEQCRMAKAHCEDLWSDFSEHADGQFLKEFRLNFHQRWFEMYLTVSLIRAGLTVDCRNPGPDVLLTFAERHVWIEAVCVTEGQAGKPDSVPPLEDGKTVDVPIKQYVMRIRNSLDEKSKKFKTYLEKGVVGHGDVLVIAINGGGIPFLFSRLSECTESSLYGVGDLVLTLNRSTGEVVGSRHEHIEKIKKVSGKEIGVRPFVDGSMDHVSAVLTSWRQPLAPPSTLGSDFVLYPNLSCRTPWVRNSLPVAVEWSFEEDESGVWKGKEIIGTLSNRSTRAVAQLPINPYM